jgi:hypothetical protein
MPDESGESDWAGLPFGRETDVEIAGVVPVIVDNESVGTEAANAHADKLLGMHPAHVDGLTLVVIRRTTMGYKSLQSGGLSHDGHQLTLVGEHGEVAITDRELAELQPVVPGNQFSACRGCDFFLFRDD